MSEATQVGSIVAYLTLRREDWNAGVRSTEQDARRLGTLNPRIRIDANTSEILAQLGLVHAAERKVGSEAAAAKPFVMNMWAALAAVAPAAAPIAAVAGGALLGLLPVAAAVALGVSGIRDEMKSGALEGTRYGQDLATVKGWMTELKTTAAGGLLGGVDQAVQRSRPLISALNSDIGQTSTQIGGIVGDAGPALLSILHQLEPLFSTVGDAVAGGAHALERWSTSGQGLTTFVAYVQAELPAVEHLLGGVITLASHLLQASAGPGAGLLHDLNLLIGLLDAIPVGVMETAIPVAVALYAAIKTGQGVTAAVNGVNAAITRTGNALGITGPKAEAAAAQQVAAGLAVQAAAAEEAATVAAAQAAMATAAAEAAVEIAAATEGTSSVLAAGATVAAEAAIEEAAAFQAAAEAAAVSAAEIGAAAEAAATTSTEAGAAASVGWSAALGPLAAVGVGLALLTSLFHNNSQAEMENKQIADGYAESLKKNANALAAVNVEQTSKNLRDQGALKLMDQLNGKAKASLGQLVGSNNGLRVSQAQLVLAVNGTEKQYDSLHDSLLRVAEANRQQGQNVRGPVKAYTATGQAALDLAGKLKQLRAAMTEQMKQQAQLAELERAAQTAINGGATATARQANALGLSSAAYLDAQNAAKQSTDQTRQQTAAMQEESDAAGLLNQALMTLAGQNLSVAQAQTSFGQSLRGVLKSLHDNGDGFKGNSEKALANQQALEGNASAARQLAQSVAQQTHSNAKAIASYQESKREIEAQLAAHNKLTPALKRYIDRLYDVKGISDYLAKHPTKTDVDNGPASAKIDRLEARIRAIKQGRLPGIDANTDAGRRKLAELQAQLDALRGKTVTVNVGVSGRGVKGGMHGSGTVQFGFADGGTVTGPGGPKDDQVPIMASPGEEITPEPQASKHRKLLKAIAADQVPGFAAGGTVGGVYKVGSGYGFQGQYFAKRKDADSAATQARHAAASQSTYDSMPGSDAWKAFLAAGTSLQQAAGSASATAVQVHDAAVSLNAAAKAAGLSHKALASIAANEKQLSADAAKRESVLSRLGTRPSAPTAYDQLAAAQGQFRSDHDKYRDAASGFDVTSVTAGPSTSSRKIGAATVTTSTPHSLSAAAIIAADAADVGQIKEFDHLIHRLVAEGLDPDYVATIAGKGPTSEALATARALAKATPAEVSKLNRLESGKGGRKALAGDLGTFLAKQYDQAGVDAAQSFVHGLVSQEKALTTQMLQLVARVEKKLHINVPVHAGGRKRKKNTGGKRHHPGSGERRSDVQVNVFGQPGQSPEQIARIAAAKVLFHVDR